MSTQCLQGCPQEGLLLSSSYTRHTIKWDTNNPKIDTWNNQPISFNPNPSLSNLNVIPAKFCWTAESLEPPKAPIATITPLQRQVEALAHPIRGTKSRIHGVSWATVEVQEERASRTAKGEQ